MLSLLLKKPTTTKVRCSSRLVVSSAGYSEMQTQLYSTGQRAYKRLKHHHHHRLSLNCEGRWGTTDDFATSLLHFPLFSTALWDFANPRPVHSLMLSSHFFLCLPCLLSRFTVLCKMVLLYLINGRHDHTTALCVSLRWSGSLHGVRLPAGSWHGLPRW